MEAERPFVRFLVRKRRRVAGRHRCAAVLLAALAASGCYESHALFADARADARILDADAPRLEAEVDVPEDAGGDYGGCVPVDDRCGTVEICGNGNDDDCDGEVDEDCPCSPGVVQSCFAGPPGRRSVGACSDGQQVCLMDGTWGPCVGGILPAGDVCNGLDNRCDGCSRMLDCELDCPGPGDPRAADGTPQTDYPLEGRLFHAGPVATWHWDVQGGLCDGMTPRFRSYELLDADSETATLWPLVSGDYTVTLTIVAEAGTRLSCRWIVHVREPGLRVEMCYPECMREDIDVFVKQPGVFTPWYPDTSSAMFPSEDECGWHNCEAHVRNPGPRADWGYAPSDLSACIGGPLGYIWRIVGYCANPRLDIDNNLSEGIGLEENINIDAPRDGETFRIMVENYSGGLAHPLVNVYCGGLRVATFGAPPDELPDFQGISWWEGVGAMWRVADVTFHVAGDSSVSCDVVGLHPPGTTEGYDVTLGDIRY